MRHKIPYNHNHQQLFNDLHYSINLMWINNTNDSSNDYICLDIDYVLNQLKKWYVANPEAQINFWYDSQCTHPAAIDNTKQLLTETSTHPKQCIALLDIQDIPFVQENAALFSSTIPVYARIDFLKLIICTHLLATTNMTSVVYADLSIGDKTDTALTKQQLYSPPALHHLDEFGMLLGYDGSKVENQFLQMLKSTQLLEAMKHAINCCLLQMTNALNRAFAEKNSSYIEHLYDVPLTATMTYVYVYFLTLKKEQVIRIRADVAEEAGNPNQWVVYQPERHGYIMFGDTPKTDDLGSFYTDKITGSVIPLNRLVQLPWIKPFDIVDFDTLTENIEHLGDAVRYDLNPGHMGKSHTYVDAVPAPPPGKEKFSPIYWLLEGEEPTRHLSYR